MTGKAQFHPYGISLALSDGNEVVLNAGPNMTIFPQGDLITFAAQIPPNVASINGATGPINLVAGPGITIDTAGTTITIFTGDGYVSESGTSAYVTEDSSSYYVTES